MRTNAISAFVFPSKIKAGWPYKKEIYFGMYYPSEQI